ncbi:MAG: hypothetical protein REI93_08300, partial [Pedobacter sp.]|nr:hypothetical protein [Pedobacter sp.]
SKFEKVNPCADGPAESCAALCLCQCCGQSIILGAFSDFQRLNPSALTVVVVFPLHLHTTTHLHQIWEPPKSA